MSHDDQHPAITYLRQPPQALRRPFHTIQFDRARRQTIRGGGRGAPRLHSRQAGRCRPGGKKPSTTATQAAPAGDRGGGGRAPLRGHRHATGTSPTHEDCRMPAQRRQLPIVLRSPARGALPPSGQGPGLRYRGGGGRAVDKQRTGRGARHANAAARICHSSGVAMSRSWARNVLQVTGASERPSRQTIGGNHPRNEQAPPLPTRSMPRANIAIAATRTAVAQRSPMTSSPARTCQGPCAWVSSSAMQPIAKSISRDGKISGLVD